MVRTKKSTKRGDQFFLVWEYYTHEIYERVGYEYNFKNPVRVKPKNQDQDVNAQG